jgi:hypothetical protein
MPNNFGKIEDEFKKQKRKLTAIIVGAIVFFGAGTFVFLYEGPIILAILSAVIVIVCIFALVRIIPQTGKAVPYIPGKSCKGWRKTPEQLLKYYKIGIPATIVLILFLDYAAGDEIGSGIGGAVAGIAAMFYLMKRIKHHVPIDDASRFELEELGLISETDVVLSIYKDFSSWNDVKDGSKVLVLTQDNLVVLNFLDRENAQKFVLPLKGLECLSISSFNASGDAKKAGVLLAMGFKDLPALRLILKGESYQDSPEVFISFFLKEIDARLLKKPKPPLVSKRAEGVTVSAGFRKIDIKDAGAVMPDSASSPRMIDL